MTLAGQLLLLAGKFLVFAVGTLLFFASLSDREFEPGLLDRHATLIWRGIGLCLMIAGFFLFFAPYGEPAFRLASFRWVPASFWFSPGFLIWLSITVALVLITAFYAYIGGHIPMSPEDRRSVGRWFLGSVVIALPAAYVLLQRDYYVRRVAGPLTLTHMPFLIGAIWVADLICRIRHK